MILKQTLQQRLTQALSPTFLEIEDESHLHVGHAGAKSGGGHFKLTIASDQFLHKNTLACHKLIYAALDGLIGKEVHALQIVIAR
jgi:BolA protein